MMGSEWVCPDLTDSGLRVKNPKEAHMKTQLSKPARSKARYTRRIQTRGARVMAQQRPQRSQGGSGAGYSSATSLPLGARGTRA